MTKESFAQWKLDKANKIQEELEKKVEAEQKKGQKGGKAFGFMSGKALFTYDPTLFQDDEGAVDEAMYDEGCDETEESKNNVDEALFAGEGADADVDFD